MVILLDVDDVLVNFTSEVNDFVNKKFNTNYKYEDSTWGFVNYEDEHREYAMTLARSYEFISNLEFKDGAVEFVNTLTSNGHDVIFLTSALEGVLDARSKFLSKAFPHLKNNIILAKRKDIIAADIIIDDNINNVATSRAKHKILVRCPWNKSCNSFETIQEGDFSTALQIIEKIL